MPHIMRSTEAEAAAIARKRLSFAYRREKEREFFPHFIKVKKKRKNAFK